MRKRTLEFTRWIGGVIVAVILVLGSVEAVQANRVIDDCWRYPVPNTGGQGKDCQTVGDCSPECDEASWVQCNEDFCCECLFR